jgi:hypothetical protein
VNFKRNTAAVPMADTMASTPLKLFNSNRTIITSIARVRMATRSSKFSDSTIDFSIHRVNWNLILWLIYQSKIDKVR